METTCNLTNIFFCNQKNKWKDLRKKKNYKLCWWNTWIISCANETLASIISSSYFEWINLCKTLLNILKLFFEIQIILVCFIVGIFNCQLLEKRKEYVVLITFDLKMFTGKTLFYYTILYLTLITGKNLILY